MNPREKFLRTIKGVNTDVPLFCPAIYNYKANFSNRSLHVFGQDERELLDAIVNEIDLLQAELITCGYDIYNVEAEALGAVVTRDKQDIFPEIEGSLLKDLHELDQLPVLDKPAGRMPLNIRVTKKLHERYGDRIYVRGAVSGPFSLAGAIYQNDKLLVDCLIDQEGVYQLLELCTDTIITYIKGFLDEGLEMVVFDSLASPPLISPEIYKELIFPFHQKIFQCLIQHEIPIRPLIMGGNTLPIMDKLIQTGANQLLLDYNIPLEDAKHVLEEYEMGFRINIDPGLLAYSGKEEITSQLKKTFDLLNHPPNLLIGTGILVNDTPLENIQFMREYMNQYYEASKSTGS